MDRMAWTRWHAQPFFRGLASRGVFSHACRPPPTPLLSERACARRWILTQASDKLKRIEDADNKLSSIVADGVDGLPGLSQFGKHARVVGPSPKLPRS